MAKQDEISLSFHLIFVLDILFKFISIIRVNKNSIVKINYFNPFSILEKLCDNFKGNILF